MQKAGRIASSLERFLLSALVFFLPSQLTYHFWPEFSHVFGIRVDYLAPAIYLTDIFIVFLFVLWLLGKPKISKGLFIWAAALGVLAFLNVFLAQNSGAAAYKWIKVFEFIFLGYYVYSTKIVNLMKVFLKPFLLSLVFFASLGILQFLNQGTLGGATYLFGERSFSAATPGIALFEIGGRQYLRPYSTFPHPNSLAGFLGVALIVVVSLWKRLAFLKWPALLLVFTALGLTFSSGAYLGLIIVGFFYLLSRKGAEQFRRTVIVSFFLAVSLSMSLPIIAKEYSSRQFGGEELYNRLILAERAGELFAKAPLFGVGLNNFIVRLPEAGISPQINWWLQPVHNIFLLLLAETGILGLLAFLYVIYKALLLCLAKKRTALVLVLVFILVSGLSDHYWLTLQQNQLLLSLVLGLSLRRNL